MTHRPSFGRPLFLIACACVAGCGAPSGRADDAGTVARPDAERVTEDPVLSAADNRIVDAFGHVPDGFEFITREEYAASGGVPPGTAASFVNRDDCCSPPRSYSYPRTVMVRKYPDVGGLDDAVNGRVEATRAMTGVVPDSIEVSEPTSPSRIEWKRIDFTVVAPPGPEVPRLGSTIYVGRAGGFTYEFVWLAADADVARVDPELARMWRAVDWSALPAADF
jgi:hypothetical protein